MKPGRQDVGNPQGRPLRTATTSCQRPEGRGRWGKRDRSTGVTWPRTHGERADGVEMRRWRWPGIRRQQDVPAADRGERLAEPEGCTERRKGRAAHAYRAVHVQSSRASRSYRGDRPTENSEGLNCRRGGVHTRPGGSPPCGIGSGADGRAVSRWDRNSKTTRDISYRTCSDENVPQNQSRGCATPKRPIQSHPEARRRGARPRARAPVDIRHSSFSGSPVSRRKPFVAEVRKIGHFNFLRPTRPMSRERRCQ